MSGFWGTAREDEWHRRKEREYEIKEEIRREELQVRRNMSQYYQQELADKDNVLELTRRMLNVSRNGQENDKKKRMSNVMEDLQEDDDVQELKVAAKKPREAMLAEADAMEETDEANETEPSSTFTTREPTGMDAVRENLLALSYAMYDSLFQAKSFQAKSFCDFLIKMGEKSLAEEIAMAAVEQTNAAAEHLRYVLDELMPHSSTPDILLERVTKCVTESRREEGNPVLVHWHARHGNMLAAFEAALTMRCDVKKFKTAFPFLEDKSERLEQLKVECSNYCSPFIIGVFTDAKVWSRFLATLPDDIEVDAYGNRRGLPAIKHYLSFAVNSMNETDGKILADAILQQRMKSNLFGCLDMSWELPGPSAAKSQSVQQVAAKYRTLATLFASRGLTETHGDVFQGEGVANHLDALHVDAMSVLLQVIKQKLKLPTRECMAQHRDSLAAFKCLKCRSTQHSATFYLGYIRALRTHELTKDHPGFKSLGLEPGQVEHTLRECGVHAEAIRGFMQDCSPDDFARQDATPDPEPCSSDAQPATATSSSDAVAPERVPS